jgi:hypothetical protein
LRTLLGFWISLPLIAGLLGAPGDPKEEGFVAIFDGKSLAGWQAANEPGHGSGCLWSAKDGAIDGVQQSPGEWGILATAKRYGDFELRLEVMSEWPFDAGILVRSTMEGHGHEVLLRASPGGDVGGIAASRIGEFRAPAKDWKKAWKRDNWNEVRVVVKGPSPEIRTWLNGSPMAECRAESKDVRVGAEGAIALKIHAGEDAFRKHIQFRNIRIQEIR